MKMNKYKMNKHIIFIFFVLALVVLVSGCARYKIEEVGDEVLPGELVIGEGGTEGEDGEIAESTGDLEETPEDLGETPENKTEDLEETPEDLGETLENKTEDLEETPETAPSKKEEGIILTYTEGDLINLAERIKVSDEDNDELTIKYGEPLDQEGKWQTEEGDAGTYETYVSVSDGKAVTKQKITIKILALNHPPVISGIDKVIEVEEGDIIELDPQVDDEDGDDVTISYEGWMNSSSYRTTYDDAGEHNVTIIASDGKAETTFTLKIIVKDINRAPVLIIE